MMFRSSTRKIRRNLPAKICVIVLIITTYLIVKKFYLYKELSSINEQIQFNFRAFNHSIPNSIEANNGVHAAHYVQPEKIIDHSPVYDKKIDASINSFEPAINKISTNQIQLEENPILDLKYENMIKADEDLIIPGLGDDGADVNNIPNISDKEIDEVMKKEAFNKLLSDRISLTRKIPDARHPMCASEKYDEDLPTASVIIIFINEVWSTLLRTIHSTLMRSPEKYLKEIILVDDSSTREELKGKLDYYIKTRLPSKVKLIRLKNRHGLIRARLAGAEVASGDVFVFLDSHCECVVGWLEPLLYRIKSQKNAVVCPIIDVINDKTFAYMFSSDRGFQVGGFTWSGHFTWIPIPDFEEKRRQSVIAPARSPTMAGGLFAIHGEYFWEIGSYDREMDVWGGENLEMSFRIWQCGGTLEIVPCSRVGHIFRSFHPYSFPGRKDTHGINTARVAEVWMDDYKRLFYLHRPDLKNVKIGDLSSRKKLREELKCNNFQWFLKNVIPQKFILDEDVRAYGRVKSLTRNFCFDNLNHPDDTPGSIGLYNCHDLLYSSQFYSLSNKGELRREELCAQVLHNTIFIPGMIFKIKGNLTMVECNDEANQKWVYENQLIRHVPSGLCLHSYGAYPEALLTVADCRPTDVNFKWKWEFSKRPDGNFTKHF